MIISPSFPPSKAFKSSYLKKTITSLNYACSFFQKIQNFFLNFIYNLISSWTNATWSVGIYGGLLTIISKFSSKSCNSFSLSILYCLTISLSLFKLCKIAFCVVNSHASIHWSIAVTRSYIRQKQIKLHTRMRYNKNEKVYYYYWVDNVIITIYLSAKVVRVLGNCSRCEKLITSPRKQLLCDEHYVYLLY